MRTQLATAKGRFLAIFESPVGVEFSKRFTKDASDYFLLMAAPVGGVAELPDVAAAPSTGPDASGGRTGAIAAASIVGALALGGAAWLARRRLLG